ncbi:MULTISPECIES: ATP-grasp domain-containing protein [Streptomyces]|uniref:Phosphoribosylglycinamide synthetase n=1 Tax=Streptomyces venezuelae TaxID=54571 RepID=A0A5P2AM64_STRVZ|nr:ATP-grasp domain-containing protein [Streptomyces venezuelae]QES19066.1 phosphoribosylglycinamide synthetase [Streptomyces venezuelae]
MTGPVTGVVVDAYTTGNLLPAAFAAHGVRLVHVQAGRTVSTALPGPDLARFAENIVHDGVATLARLRALAPGFVIAGQDSGVALADRLSEELGLPTNGTALSAARWDKYVMGERLRARGLHCARQFRSADPADLIRWRKESGPDADQPVVVKPVASAGTDRVRVCRTEAEIEAAAATVLAGPDVYGRPPAEVLVQSYLEGTEYIVDTVSRDGAHFFCGVWRYHKRLVAGRPVYDRDTLLAPDEEPVPALLDYVGTVLDALGIRHGSAHAEVIVTPRGPALVEIGARMNGNMNPGLHRLCLGHDQAALTALAYLAPEEFHARWAARVYRRLRPAVVCNTATERSGVVTRVDTETIRRIEGLPSVHAVAPKLAPGDRMRPTTDLLSSPLRVFLTHEDSAVLDRDVRTVRALADRVYEIGDVAGVGGVA